MTPEFQITNILLLGFGGFNPRLQMLKHILETMCMHLSSSWLRKPCFILHCFSVYSGNLTGLKPGLSNSNNYQNKTNMMKNASGSSLTNTGRSSSPMMTGVTSPIGSGTPAWQPSPQHQPKPNYAAGIHI